MRKKYVLAFGFIYLLFTFFFFYSDIQAGEIKDAESAKHGEDASRYRIVDTYQFPGFKLIQFKLPTLSIYSYMLISDGQALVVDPCRDISVFLDVAKKEGVKIIGVYLSHSHADFVAGHLEMAKAVNCPIYQSHKSGVKYPFKPLKEGSTIRVGKALIKFMETPGHTPDGMCGLVYGPTNPDVPELMFTGDVLFVGSVGRPDLLGGTASAAWLASAFFDSWTHKISKLHDTVRIFPAHGAGSLCGAHLSDRPYSTIGEEKASNPYLKHKHRSEFIASLIQDLPEAPQYFKYNVQMNKNGPPLIEWDRGLPPEKAPDMALVDPKKTYVVDLRDADAYASGHIPNSVNIALRGRFETWVGIMVPWDANLILVGDKAELKEALFRLHRVGYTPGIISMDTWKNAGMPLKESNPITPEELYRLMQEGKAPVIVDVRLPAEWMALRIGTVLNLPLNHLSELSSQLDPDEPVVTVCNSAYRSSMAAGILERKGFKMPRNLKGGSRAWIKAGLPVYEGSKGGAVRAAGPKKEVRLPDRISPSELKRLIMDLPGTFELIDLRPEYHFADAHLPGSINIHVADVLSDPGYLVGAGPLVLVDRDGSIAMAVGGILSQKTERPIKVLYGGLEAYWNETRGTPPSHGVLQKHAPSPAAASRPVAPAMPPPTQKPPKIEIIDEGC
ncbi:MAG: MBL fold metallo-hydrolase [Deltaproteobacteria bacterium]|nr:MBL fold metallo-hydrolase [Deltaproteobacteria bacterium]